ncbi:sodium:calcium antiporter [Exiguobacterium sp. SL-9]|uniref:sodium:calcium antiporter n=1 Tax=Exiguobacterium sp. SL-9 TaxID=2510963 RepID=UPI00103E7BC4|nr:sodium:calcium antiporter [Exiguobacterium sp. SL-9]TCI21897.1 sodium:calcium antiporter [Exiguobacterium sp. SL-9]
MVFIYFILAAAITVYAAIKLSTYADVISEKSTMSGMLVGTVLLAGATSLPEVTTSVSAVMINNPDIAIGNMLGSNLFNIFILAMFDLYYRQKRLFNEASRDHLYTASLGLMLTLVTMLALVIRIDFTILGIGIDALLIAGLYAIGIYYIGQRPKELSTEREVEQEVGVSVTDSIPIKRAVIGFIIAALVIMAAGTALSVLGDQIAVVTGLGSSFVGSFLIAASTSLPEAVAVFVALKLGNVNLAFGSILGSNIFNMLIIALSDVFYRGGSILADVSTSHLVTAIGITILSILVMYSVLRKDVTSKFRYVLPSVLVILVYFASSYFIFIG